MEKFNLTYTGAQVQALLDKVSNLVDLVYPVGAIYMSVSSTSPQTLFGGTWVQLENRFLLGAGSSYTAGATGGASTVNLQHSHTVNSHSHKVTAAGTVAGHTLTIAEMPTHSHREQINNGSTDGWYRTVIGSGSDGYGKNNWTLDTYTYTMNEGGGGSHSHGFTGTEVTSGTASPGTNNKLSSAQSILPPYLVVYMWKRTA